MLIWSLYLLIGHGVIVQDCWEVEFPVQFNPPLDGGGFEQLRFLNWVPLPHVLLHVPQEFHSDQLPSILKFKVFIWICGILKFTILFVEVSGYWYPDFFSSVQIWKIINNCKNYWTFTTKCLCSITQIQQFFRKPHFIHVNCISYMKIYLFCKPVSCKELGQLQIQYSLRLRLMVLGCYRTLSWKSFHCRRWRCKNSKCSMWSNCHLLLKHNF